MAKEMNMPPQTKKSGLPRLVSKFIATESAAGLIMIGCLVLATVMANTFLRDWYEAFIHTPIVMGVGEYILTLPFKEWVKDILMVFFFLVVAMELKVEILEGFLSKPGQVTLPLIAAFGGVLVPALIYYSFNYATPEHIAGWAVPSATDIAFALAIVVLAGPRVPPAAKIFLLAIAIFDDLFAIIIIALFYSDGLQYFPLLMAFAGIAILLTLNTYNVTLLLPYMLVCLYLWFCLHNAGIHTTLAGVATGMAIPLRDGDETDHQRYSPLKHCMHLLHGWVSFMILPIFALTAAGIDFSGMSTESLLSPVPLGIALGLFFGKQIGIFSVTWLLVKLRITQLPEGMGWRHVYAIAVTAGIGFTMSLFIGLLAFDNSQLQQMVKTGVIAGSLLSSIMGYVMLRYFCPPLRDKN